MQCGWRACGGRAARRPVLIRRHLDLRMGFIFTTSMHQGCVRSSCSTWQEFDCMWWTAELASRAMLNILPRAFEHIKF
jgi:hypothetical protein